MNQRQEIIERLKTLEIATGKPNLLNICEVIAPELRGAPLTMCSCEVVRQRLISLLSETDADVQGECALELPDLLRKAAKGYAGDRGRVTLNVAQLIDCESRADLKIINALADKVEQALCEAYTKGCEDGMGMANAKDAQAEYLRGKNDGYDEGWDAGFASADDWCGQHEDAMAEHGWYRVLDADKAPVRIGDKVDSDHHEDGTVMGVQFYEMPRGIRTLVAVRPDGWDVATWHSPDEYRHHKQPTVEDVLREFALRVAGKECMTARPDVITEYAAKLRLAGDAE